jgi:probable phosphoglycerate mutase
VQLLLIRHGLPIRIDGGSAPADPHLAPEGVTQAQRLAEHWSAHGVDAVYASPLRRALETAEPLAAASGCEVVVDAGLREFDAHEHSYVPLEELRADQERWRQMIEEWMSPEAEARRQAFRATVVAAVDGIAERHQGQRVAVVCHGGVINAYLSDVISLATTMWFEPAYTSVSRALVGGGRKQLVSVNETPHLPGLVLPTEVRAPEPA